MNGNSAIHSTQLMINTEELGVVHVHSASSSWMQSTSVVVAHVNQGDNVFGAMGFCTVKIIAELCLPD